VEWSRTLFSYSMYYQENKEDHITHQSLSRCDNALTSVDDAHPIFPEYLVYFLLARRVVKEFNRLPWSPDAEAEGI
jgi:hypothetical protein